MLLALAAALRAPALVPWAVALGGSAYALALAVGEATLDARAPLVASALFVAAELGDRGSRRVPPCEPALLVRAALLLAAGAAAATAFGAAALAAAGGVEAGVGLAAVGAGAAVAVLALVVGVVARTRD